MMNTPGNCKNSLTFLFHFSFWGSQKNEKESNERVPGGCG
jgi:hypothetical protein